MESSPAHGSQVHIRADVAPKQPWLPPEIHTLPPLTQLTLQTGIPG